jgi:hypothetical protein
MIDDQLTLLNVVLCVIYFVDGFIYYHAKPIHAFKKISQEFLCIFTILNRFNDKSKGISEVSDGCF